MSGAQIRVLVVDDNEIFRHGTRAVLEAVEGIVVCGEGHHVTSAIEAARDTRPDLVLLGVNRRESSPVGSISRIRRSFPRTNVIVLSDHITEETFMAAIRAGASGILPKMIEAQALVDAVQAVMEGSDYINPQVLDTFLKPLRQGDSKALLRHPRLAGLSRQEKRVVSLVALGLRNHQIADEMEISAKTVRNHLSKIYKRLEVSDHDKLLALIASIS